MASPSASCSNADVVGAKPLGQASLHAWQLQHNVSSTGHGAVAVGCHRNHGNGKAGTIIEDVIQL